jgi:hypothetical protein
MRTKCGGGIASTTGSGASFLSQVDLQLRGWLLVFLEVDVQHGTASGGRCLRMAQARAVHSVQSGRPRPTTT